jgi:hypothetical protein
LECWRSVTGEVTGYHRAIDRSERRMKALRIFFCIFSLCASLVALAHHLGYDLWGCASCSFVNELPMSAALAWGGPVVLLALAYALFAELRWAKAALALAAVGSVTLGWWMVHRNTLCPVCMLVHIGVVSAALSLVPAKARAISPLFFSLAITFAATGGWDIFGTEQGIAIFRPRGQEVIPSGKVYVLFTDPQCPRCKLVENQIAARPQPIHILYRWTLLPQDTYRSIRACALLEMARAKSPEKFARLRQEIMQLVPPLTDAAMLDAAAQAGLGEEARGWLDDPAETALNAIAEDQTTSRELRIQSLPALAELYGPDPSGTRMMRLVPFSDIRVRR